MRADQNLQALIKKTVARLSAGKKKDEKLLAFARVFLARGVADDMAAIETAALAQLVRHAYKFASDRRPGRPKIEIRQDDALGAGSTVIEIINDDMPFLVDSVLGLLNERGLEIDLVLHPLITVERNNKGGLKAILPDEERHADGAAVESFIHLHVRRLEADMVAGLKDELVAVLKDVRTAVLDWRPMLDRLHAVVSHFKTDPPPVPVAELAESVAFLEWLADNNFTLLGVREYRFTDGKKATDFKPVPNSGLGILSDPDVHVLRRAGKLVSMTPELREFLMLPAPLIITKANVKANVHRRVYMDYVGVKQFDSDGNVTGEIRFIGLFTSGAYTRSPRYIPLLRKKIDRAMELSGFNPESHSGKALMNTLENFPRDELFQIDAENLFEIANGILQLDERPRTRVFVRRDRFDRFVSLLVFVPRDRFNTSVRMRIGDHLAEVFDGRQSAFYPAFPEGALVRIHYIIGRNETKTPTPDLAELEATVASIVQTWDDHLDEAVLEAYGDAEAPVVSRRYRSAFSAAYQDAFAPDQALADIAHMESLADGRNLAIDFYRKDDDDTSTIRLKLYHPSDPIALSDRLPILQNMGMRAIAERSYQVRPTAREGGESVVWIHDIVLESVFGTKVDLATLKDLLEDCFAAVWNGRAESDGYNALVLGQSIAWRDISILRTIGKYLVQTAIPYSNQFMAETLVKHAAIARTLVEMFHVRFGLDGGSTRDARTRRLVRKIESALDDVASLNEDRVLRRFSNVVMATLRTNFFQTGEDGGARPAIAIKLRSRDVEELPEPKPFAEIFVYAPDVEGIHLRGGAIARGGLRWSDRPEDFRTEVLGLAKAQQVKNAVIVPVGAKGGFVPKRLDPQAGREEIQAEAIRCYRIFISSLLDVTDNLSGDKVVPPLEVIRHDGDDPYLVVAADKGTATFSDIANGISEERGFWLADAFASGGSAGYDHKKMGITARGAWEAVKRHFREMEHDIQTEPFTAVGCGDMSGDVFGNGMLLSTQTRLLAAFDHRDIFFDPDPDPATSYAERKRLFELPRSSWQDYSSKLISKGGGVFSRSVKSIELTPEIRELTGLTAKSVPPNELIRAILKMPADLLWFGGIGTYVRATAETDEQVGDRATDALRITARDVGAKVVGEGANLGFTQRARIEFAQAGGRVNTDAVDNSAGVNSSDVEVNIKIALGAAEASGKLTRKARNKLLADMTDEVAELVLRNNYQQTLSLSLARRNGISDLGYQVRFMQELEHRGLLDREIEFLPDDVQIAERMEAGKPLVRPELAVIMAYAKITLFDELLRSKVPDEPYFDRELMEYFPVRMRKKYASEIAGHRLRREIVATLLANSMINRGGPTLVGRLSDETGATVSEIATAYALARDCFDIRAMNAAVDGLDNKVASETQMALYAELQDLLHRETVWFLKNADPASGLAGQVDHFRTGIGTLADALDKVLPERARERVARAEKTLLDRKVPKDIAARIARLRYLSRGPDIVLIAAQTKRPVADVAAVFFTIGVRLGVDRLAARAAEIDPTDYFDRLALGKSVESIFTTQRALVAEILRSAKSRPLDAWSKKNGDNLERTEAAVNEMIDGGEFTLAKAAVAGSYLQDLLTA